MTHQTPATTFDHNNTLPVKERLPLNKKLLEELGTMPPVCMDLYLAVRKKVTEDILYLRTISQPMYTLTDNIIAWCELGYVITFEKSAYDSYRIEMRKASIGHSYALYVSGKDLQANAADLIKSIYDKYFAADESTRTS